MINIFAKDASGYKQSMRWFERQITTENCILEALGAFTSCIHFIDKDCHVNGGHLYIKLLVCSINGLYNFTLGFNDSDPRKKHFISIYLYSVDFYFIVNDYKNQSILFSSIVNEEQEREDNTEADKILQLDNEVKLSYSEADIVVNWLLRRQKIFELPPSPSKYLSYLKYSYEDFAKEFLPFFEENIYDIPKDCILWETPLLKETMSNFEALKKYAVEKGWII